MGAREAPKGRQRAAQRGLTASDGLQNIHTAQGVPAFVDGKIALDHAAVEAERRSLCLASVAPEETPFVSVRLQFYAVGALEFRLNEDHGKITARRPRP